MIGLLVAMALAGCTEDTGGDIIEDTDVGGNGESGQGSDGMVAFKASTASTDVVEVIESGSFTYQDACALATQECASDDYSLTDLMEPDTAYFLHANLTQEGTSTGGHPVNFRLEADEGVRDYDGPEYDGETGTRTITATLLAPGSEDVILNVYPVFVADSEPAEYTLAITMTPISDTIPQHAPAAVTVPAGGDLIVETLSSDGRVAVYGGEDQLLNVTVVKASEGSAQDNTPIVRSVEEDTEFVVFNLDGTWMRLYVRQDGALEPPVLRHLPLEVMYEDHGSIDAGGPKTFTFDLDVPGLQVGFRFGSFSPCYGADGCYTVTEATATMTSPDGAEVLSLGEYNCYLCGGESSIRTDYDDGPQPPGTYTIDWDSEQVQNVDFQSIVVNYVR